MFGAVGRRVVESQRALRALPITLDDSFEKQWEYIVDRSRFRAVMCSRRAGKTDGAIVRTAKLCEENPGRRVLYIHQTATNANLQFFQPLKEFLKKKGIQFRSDDQLLLIYFANGSFVRCMGCDDVGDVKTKVGDKWDEVIVDEMQDYADSVLFLLIDKAISATLIDRAGTLTCQGTPPITEAGFWYDLITKSNYRQFNWNLFDNPKIPHDWQTVYNARGLTEADAVVQREVFGRIAVDPNSMVFCYVPSRNNMGPAQPYDRWFIEDDTEKDKDGNPKRHYETTVPEPDHPAWRHCMGLDLGVNDHDAIVVLGWRVDDGTKRLWERWSWQKRHEDIDELAEVFLEAVGKWRPQVIVGDNGGLGKKTLLTLQNRFGGYTFKPKPASVLDSVGLLNDEFRTGRLLVDPNGLIAHDAKRVVWKPGKHGVEVSEAFHSDIMDATRYAHSCAYHYAAKDKPAELSPREQRIRHLERSARIRQDPFNPYRRAS